MPLNGQASKLGPLSSSRSSLNNAEYYQPKPIFRKTDGFRLLTIVLAPPQCVDRQSVDRRSIDYQFIDDPSTDDPSTDDPSTILLAEFYNIDPPIHRLFWNVDRWFFAAIITWSRLTSGLFLGLKLGLGRPAAGRGLRPLLTQPQF
jgi:hypothetical protein